MPAAEEHCAISKPEQVSLARMRQERAARDACFVRMTNQADPCPARDSPPAGFRRDLQTAPSNTPAPTGRPPVDERSSRQSFSGNQKSRRRHRARARADKHDAARRAAAEISPRETN